MSNPEHEAVEGGFVCGIGGCEETRETPLGIKRHRATHTADYTENRTEEQ